MSIIGCPPDVSLEQLITCAICDHQRQLRDMTVGLHDQHDRQVLVCEAHFRDGSRLYSGWATVIAERQWSLHEAVAMAAFEDSDVCTLG
jgi:hypothetical protein